MNLEVLLQRAQEIEQTILSMTGQLNALHGHKTEVAHWIEQLKNPVPDTQSNETAVASLDEVPVE